MTDIAGSKCAGGGGRCHLVCFIITYCIQKLICNSPLRKWSSINKDDTSFFTDSFRSFFDKSFCKYSGVKLITSETYLEHLWWNFYAKSVPVLESLFYKVAGLKDTKRDCNTKTIFAKENSIVVAWLGSKHTSELQ